MKQVVILGTTGSGKTQLAARLAQKLQCPHIELDSLFWLPNWMPTSDERSRNRVRGAIAAVTYGFLMGTM